MKTLTLKILQIFEARLNVVALKNGLSRSEIVRRALVEYFSRDDVSNQGSFLDLSQDLAGSIEDSPELSTNKALFEGYGK
jgi:hypothetical protein